MRNKKIGTVSFIMISILGLISIGLFLGGEQARKLKNYSMDRLKKAEIIVNNISYTDSELTTMVNIYVSSKGTLAMENYEKSRKILENNMNDLRNLTHNLEAKNYISSLMLYNKRIQKLEQKSIALLNEGNYIESYKIIEESDYVKLKKIYSENLKNAEILIKDEMLNGIYRYDGIEKIINIFNMIINISLVVLTLYLFFKLRKYFEEQQLLINEIEDANATLEMKVEDRTRDAEEKAEELQKRMEETEKISKALEKEAEERKLLQEEAEKNRVEAEERARFEEAISGLSYSLNGMPNIMELSEKAIDVLNNYLTIQMGAIYVSNENGKYIRTGSYGYNKGIKSEFNEGEGSVGEAAKQKKIIIIENIPEECLFLFGGGKIKHIQ